MTWTDNIASCFGLEDKKFAHHPSDRVCATSLLIAALNEGCNYQDFCDEIEDHLNSLGCLPGHISSEMKKVKSLKTYFG